jgi:hypothetical protein
MFKRLKKFRVERNIDNKLYIHEVEVKNLLSEYKEYKDAVDVGEQVDALCDLSVFTANALHYLDYDFKGRMFQSIYILADRYMGMDVERALGLILNNLKNATIREQTITWLQVLYTVCRRTIIFMQYDFKKCMLETIKEISSREQDPKQAQAWYESGAVGKWEKNREQDPLTLYIADYTSCKREPLG